MKTLNLILLSFIFPLTLQAACDGLTKTFPMIDPVDQKPFEVTAKIYRPKMRNNEKIPTVFILPPIVGETVLDRRLASRFCNNGMASYILNVVKAIPLEEEIPNLYVHNDTYIRALVGVQTVIADLKNDPQLNGNYGILGMSLGGMIATYIAGSEPLIKASVIVVGAGNVPGVLAYSNQETVQEQRDARKKLFNIPNDVAYENLLKPLVPNDPINVAANVRPGSMYMFIANNDRTVPTKYQQELRSKVPDPLVFVMNANHLNGIIKAGTIHAGKITNFFYNQLQ